MFRSLANTSSSILPQARRVPISTLRLARSATSVVPPPFPSAPSSSAPSSSSLPPSTPSPTPTLPTNRPPRKASLDSKPLRSGSSPSTTRSSVRRIYAFSTSQAHDLPLLAGHLPKEAKRVSTGGQGWCWWVPLGSKSEALSGQGLLDEQTGLVHTEDLGSPENGEIWILENGSFVSWGLERDVAWKWWTNLAKPAGFEVGRYPKMEDESLDFFVDPAEPTTRLQGDTVLLASSQSSTSSLLSRYTFSEALSRSSQLSVLESQLASLLARVQSVPAFLAKEGKGPYKRKEVIQRLGELLVVRQGVNLQGVGDIPELYWDEPVLEGYFTGLMSALEVKQRVNDLNTKITHAQEVHGILKDLLTEKSTHDMEVIIIALIFIEASLGIWSHWDGLLSAFGLNADPKTELSLQH
ncbi:hypothetical protein BDY24DRAFT_386870 [Mrakia frigida]|uniref:RMD1 family protein n=1 Tax=Mrakia frigida TaxID=29902 RepID=UPI003FCC0E00